MYALQHKFQEKCELVHVGCALADLDPSGSPDLMFYSGLQRELDLHWVIISYRGV